MNGSEISVRPVASGHVLVRSLAAPPSQPAEGAVGQPGLEVSDIRNYWVSLVRARMQEITGLESDYGCHPLPMWDGTAPGEKSRYGKTYQSVWPQLLNRCRNTNVNPYRFLRYTIAQWNGMQPPGPNFVLCAEAFKHFFSAPREELQLQTALQVQQDHASIRFSELLRDETFSGDPARWRLIVHDRTPPLTPLFRYCLACQVGLGNETGRLLPKAARQYLLDRELYDVIWGAYLPMGLVTMTNEQILRLGV